MSNTPSHITNSTSQNDPSPRRDTTPPKEDRKPLFIKLKSKGPIKAKDSSRWLLSYIQPVIIVELHDDEYYISARFNLQTSIRGFQECYKAKHARFFHSVALRYYHQQDERFEAEPGPDPYGSFTVTDSSTDTKQLEGSVNAKVSPAGSVRATWTKAEGMTVQYKLSTWSTSVTRIVDGAGKLCHEWYWRGTQYDTDKLSPDHLESVTRTITVTKKIPTDEFPERSKGNSTRVKDRIIIKKLTEHLRFKFAATCYVKELGGGMINQLSFPGELSAGQLFGRKSNPGKLLKPIESVDFIIEPEKEEMITLVAHYGEQWPSTKTTSLKEEESKMEMRYEKGDIVLRGLQVKAADVKIFDPEKIAKENPE